MEKYFSWAAKILLFGTALTPLIITPSLFLFPFVFGKVIFFRVLVELALVFGVVVLVLRFWRLPRQTLRSIVLFLKSPLTISILGFFVVAAISAILAASPFRAFFGDIERGEGFLGLLHFVLFFVLVAAVFEKRDWLLFFGGLIGVGAVTSVFAWLQYFGVNHLPFSMAATSQPGSFAGNPAFLSSFLILLIGAAAILFQRLPGRIWRIVLVLFSLFFTATVLITSIRGAVLGLVAGAFVLFLYFIVQKGSRPLLGKISVRVFALTLLVFLIAFTFAFWFTRTAQFWQSVPGLARFAKASFDIPSVQTRLIALGISWEAFKEKPVFGWGPEHFSVAYNKYYNPRNSFYAEDWFDRAHNKPAEVLVMHGVLGLVFYLAIFAISFYLVRRNPFLMAALAAYFVQNLFLFDNPASYLVIFGVWGYFASFFHPVRGKTPEVSAAPLARASNGVKWSSIFIAVAVGVGVCFSLYTYQYVPVKQAVILRKAVETKVGEKMLAASDNFFKPYNYLQPSLRGQLEELLYRNNLFTNPQFRALSLKALDFLEEAAEKDGFEPRQYVRLTEAYNELARSDSKFFEKSERFAKKAVALSPTRQGLLHHLSFVLAGLDRFEEAIAVNRKALALDPRVYKSHYQLGIALALAADAPENKKLPKGLVYKEETLKEFDTAWTLAKGDDYILFLDSDLKNLEIIYSRWKEYAKATEVLEVALRAYPAKKDFYTDLISLYRTLRDADGIIKTAEKLKIVRSELADDLDIIIDLARKQKWEILDTL